MYVGTGPAISHGSISIHYLCNKYFEYLFQTRFHSLTPELPSYEHQHLFLTPLSIRAPVSCHTYKFINLLLLLLD